MLYTLIEGALKGYFGLDDYLIANIVDDIDLLIEGYGFEDIDDLGTDISIRKVEDIYNKEGDTLEGIIVETNKIGAECCPLRIYPKLCEICEGDFVVSGDSDSLLHFVSWKTRE